MDATSLFSFTNKDKLMLIGVLMEIGNAICLEDKIFDGLYYVEKTQDEFLRGVSALKAPKEKVLNVF